MDALKDVQIHPGYDQSKLRHAVSQADSAATETESETEQVQQKDAGNNNVRKPFTIQEDEQLCHSWLTIFQGWNNRGVNFWSRVRKHYDDNRTWDTVRSDVSLCHRWSSIQRLVNKFYLVTEEIDKKSKYKNKRAESKKKFAAAKRKFLKDHKRPFSLDHCWFIIHGSEKWEEFMMKPDNIPRATRPSTPASARPISSIIIKTEIDDFTPISDFTPHLQDIRRKPEKQLTAKKKSQDEAVRKLLEQNEAVMEILATKEDRLVKRELKMSQREQRMEDERIMRVDISDMDDMQKTYYAHRQAEIAAQYMDTDQF